MNIYRLTVWIHGVYYLVTGLWPIFHIGSFMEVTGPKVDIWLVRTVGVLVTAIAIAIFTGLKDKNRTVLTLGIASCIGFAGIDLYYVLNDTISPVYLLDAVGQTVLLVGWLISAGRNTERAYG